MAGKRQLFLLATTHHCASIEVRERIATAGDKQHLLQERLRQLEGLTEFTILNTCNRVEIYGVTENGTNPQQVETAFCELHGITLDEYRSFSLSLADDAAIQHLFAVAAGLDSQMIGETEILGQVKQAYQSASEQKLPGPWLHKVFQKSFQVAKWIRTNTGVSRGQISIGNIAVELAQRIFGDLHNSRVLLIGSGEVGEKTAQAMVSRGVKHISVTSRTAANAEKLASEIGGKALPYDNIQQAIIDHEIVIGSTSAHEAIVRAHDLRKGLHKRWGRPLFLIDLALPRDFEPECASLPDVFLYNLDDLSAIANENLKARQNEVAKGHEHAKGKAKSLWQQISG